MNWKIVFAASIGVCSLGIFLLNPQFSSAAGENEIIHSGSVIGHASSGEAPAHGNYGAGNVNNQRSDLHAAMGHVANAESYLSQVRQRGDAHEILSARRSLHQSERYYIGLLSTSSGVSVEVVEELHSSGVPLAQIGYDLKMVRYSSSSQYVNSHDLDMSGLSMDGDHSVHTGIVHDSVADHHEVIGNSNRNNSHGTVIVSPGSSSRRIYPNNYNNRNSNNYHSSGGMGGMH